jgi:hypothetical protein
MTISKIIIINLLFFLLYNCYGLNNENNLIIEFIKKHPNSQKTVKLMTNIILKKSTNSWIRLKYSFFLDFISEKEFISSSGIINKKTEAYYWVGKKYIFKKNFIKAKEYFKKSREAFSFLSKESLEIDKIIGDVTPLKQNGDYTENLIITKEHILKSGKIPYEEAHND